MHDTRVGRGDAFIAFVVSPIPARVFLCSRIRIRVFPSSRAREFTCSRVFVLPFSRTHVLYEKNKGLRLNYCLNKEENVHV